MRRSIVGAFLVSLAVIPAAGQDSMKVGTAEAARGATAYGQLQVARGSDAATDVAVAVVHGAKPGKVVGFIAGSHGTEYASIVALTQLVSRLDPKALAGTVIIAPLLNVASFEQMTVHLNPVDRKGMNAGYPGNGTLGHITGELFQEHAKVKMGGVQYRGSAAIITDLLGGHIDIAMDSMAPYVSNVQEGKLRALAIAGASRWPGLPDVPTVAESGLPGFEASVWYALLTPVRTPADVIDKLNAAVNAFLKTDKAQDLFGRLGVQGAGGTPADLKKFVADEIEKWGPIVKAANISF